MSCFLIVLKLADRKKGPLTKQPFIAAIKCFSLMVICPYSLIQLCMYICLYACVFLPVCAELGH